MLLEFEWNSLNLISASCFVVFLELQKYISNWFDVCVECTIHILFGCSRRRWCWLFQIRISIKRPKQWNVKTSFIFFKWNKAWQLMYSNLGEVKYVVRYITKIWFSEMLVYVFILITGFDDVRYDTITYILPIMSYWIISLLPCCICCACLFSIYLYVELGVVIGFWAW